MRSQTSLHHFCSWLGVSDAGHKSLLCGEVGVMSFILMLVSSNCRDGNVHLECSACNHHQYEGFLLFWLSRVPVTVFCFGRVLFINRISVYWMLNWQFFFLFFFGTKTFIYMYLKTCAINKSTLLVKVLNKNNFKIFFLLFFLHLIRDGPISFLIPITDISSACGR